MKNQDNKELETERNMLPFVIDFAKFATGFVAIVTVALFVMKVTG